ncbi:MAG: rRNA maturation RNase YbeY [Patescibacteria group bacterium]
MNKNIDLVFRNLTSDKEYDIFFFKNILETAAQELKLKEEIGVSVNLVRETKIRELNKKYRKKDKPTDVLSFQIQEKLEIGKQKLEVKDLGDIFICLSIAKNEAKEENIGIEYKLAQLTVHGFLHLLGYDHEKLKKGADKMFSLEKKILSKINGKATHNSRY